VKCLKNIVHQTVSSSQWHLHSEVPLYETAIKDHGGRELAPDDCKPGDIVLRRDGRYVGERASLHLRLLLIPMLYVVFQTLREKTQRKSKATLTPFVKSAESSGTTDRS
jgi:hypothetical protein